MDRDVCISLSGTFLGGFSAATAPISCYPFLLVIRQNKRQNIPYLTWREEQFDGAALSPLRVQRRIPWGLYRRTVPFCYRHQTAPLFFILPEFFSSLPFLTYASPSACCSVRLANLHAFHYSCLVPFTAGLACAFLYLAFSPSLPLREMDVCWRGTLFLFLPLYAHTLASLRSHATGQVHLAARCRTSSLAGTCSAVGHLTTDNVRCRCAQQDDFRSISPAFLRHHRHSISSSASVLCRLRHASSLWLKHGRLLPVACAQCTHTQAPALLLPLCLADGTNIQNIKDRGGRKEKEGRRKTGKGRKRTSCGTAWTVEKALTHWDLQAGTFLLVHPSWLLSLWAACAALEPPLLSHCMPAPFLCP